MNLLFRPSTLVALAAVLAVAAGVMVFWPVEAGVQNRAVALPVPKGDQEIAWLNPATSAVSWERFVAAVQRLPRDRPDLQVHVFVDAKTFPSQTADVPELAITVGGNSHKLWFRWYKLTGELSHREWVEALSLRQPTPLAILGGGSSDRARDLAMVLAEERSKFSAPPLFLVSTASLETVHGPSADQSLMEIYAHRTFRFCFTNRQMARALVDFVWSQPDLRPDAEPVYLPRWDDDPYSGDLADEFRRVLQQSRDLQEITRDWAWWAGASAGGSDVLGLNIGSLLADRVHAPPPFWSLAIPYGVGAYNRPNQWEEEAAEKLMEAHDLHSGQRRPLLVLPCAPQPARRFLHALFAMAPDEARRFVVATGDSVDFNSIYRDRDLAWPIQDLPVPLVCFCQRNPVDPSAFRPDTRDPNTQAPDPSGPTSTGTQDLLLYRDIVETLAEAAYATAGLCSTADQLNERFWAAKLKDGRSRFTPRGNQRSGTSEFVVCLRPVRSGDRTRPEARLQVWSRSTDPDGSRKWVSVPVAGQAELLVPYTPGTGG